MPQKQYTNYRADILSFELRDALVGVLKPGRYIGYDTIAYGTPSSGNINITLSHDNGINKYDQQIPPVLEAQRGVAVSTQGVIIAEDQDVDLTLTFRSHVSGGIHVIYMRHTYIDTAGGDPAIYGIVSANRAGGQPALPNPTRDVIIGVIMELSYGTESSDLTYHPFFPGIGDDQLKKLLFSAHGSSWDTYDIGNSIPSQGIIGNRNFSSNNYIDDYDSITKALSDLDAALKVEENARIAVGNRPIDSANWGALSDNARYNVSTLAHGLMPILSGNSYQVINGNGTWVSLYQDLGSNPTFLTVSGTINNREIYRLGYLANIKRIHFDGVMSYSNAVIPSGTAIISIPSTSFNPAPEIDYYGFIWMYSGTAWVPLKMKYTTARSIVLLEETPFTVGTDVSFRVSFMI